MQRGLTRSGAIDGGPGLGEETHGGDSYGRPVIGASGLAFDWQDDTGIARQDEDDVVPVDAALFSGGSRRALPGSDTQVAAIAEAERALARVGPLRSMDDVALSEDGRRIDVAIIALHGKFGEDGTIQGMLDLLGVPYTGSGVLASALAMDKIVSKRLLRAAGVNMPDSVDIPRRSGLDGRNLETEVASMGYPVMVKPSRQGSTIGMSKVAEAPGLLPAVAEAFKYDTQVLIEQFKPGTEITVGLLGNSDPQPLPIVEIVPAKGITILRPGTPRARPMRLCLPASLSERPPQRESRPLLLIWRLAAVECPEST